MAKIVKPDQNISGMEISVLMKRYLTYKLRPFINLYEGPKLKYLFELLLMHTGGRLLVLMDVKYPKAYKIYRRISNSLVFRYNHYRNQINHKKAQLKKEPD